jgi:hypothetical protein
MPRRERLSSFFSGCSGVKPKMFVSSSVAII